MSRAPSGGLRPAQGALQGLANGVAADRLTKRHFTMHGDAGVSQNLDVATLDPLLRALLFTDGTVTRSLEAQTLSRVEVEVVEQVQTTLSDQAARYLESDEAKRCYRRRVTMKTDDSTPVVWAESHILPERLPTGFLGLLDQAHGIGGSIEQSRLESRRELLWFCLDKAPLWDGGVERAAAVIRLYRIITNNSPALLIREAFAVQSESGVYSPLGWSGAVARPAAEHTSISP